MAQTLLQAQVARQSAEYRHGQNLQHELRLQHQETNIRLQQQGMQPFPNLSYCEYGAKVQPDQPPAQTHTNEVGTPNMATVVQQQEASSKEEPPQQLQQTLLLSPIQSIQGQTQGTIVVPTGQDRESAWDSVPTHTLSSDQIRHRNRQEVEQEHSPLFHTSALISALEAVCDEEPDPREEIERRILSRFALQASRDSFKKTMERESLEELLNAEDLMAQKQASYLERLESKRPAHAMRKSLETYKELFPGITGVIGVEHCQDHALILAITQPRTISEPEPQKIEDLSYIKLAY